MVVVMSLYSSWRQPTIYLVQSICIKQIIPVTKIFFEKIEWLACLLTKQVYQCPPPFFVQQMIVHCAHLDNQHSKIVHLMCGKQDQT